MGYVFFLDVQKKKTATSKVTLFRLFLGAGSAEPGRAAGDTKNDKKSKKTLSKTSISRVAIRPAGNPYKTCRFLTIWESFWQNGAGNDWERIRILSVS